MKIETHVASIKDEVVPKSVLPSARLFHYTTSEGLKGIVESGRLWATHFDFLNDPGEIRAGEDLVREIAIDLRGQTPEWDPTLLAGFLEDWETDPLSALVHVSVASFSERGDDLTQWILYGSNGLGYSIGFDDLQLPTDRDVRWVQCEYKKETVAAEAHAMFSLMGGVYMRERSSLGARSPEFQQVGGHIRGWMSIRASTIALRLKHEAYEHEREWRIVAFPLPARPGMDVRAGRHGLTPYLGLDLRVGGKLPITQVILGPKLTSPAAYQAAKLFLSGHGYSGESLVDSSSVPYR